MTKGLIQRFILASLLVIAACLSVVVAMEYAVPVLADWYYQDQYRNLAAECDQAMHEEAALRAGSAGAAKHPTLTLSADVALMICHDYDKLRKHLLVLGVDEHRLALHSLEALEVEQIPVSRLVDPHRMERF